MPNSGVNTSYYNSCCGQFAGSKNALGHGQISNVDPLGRTVHSAAVADYDTHTNPSNPIDAKTLAETTTRYRDDGRIAATTTWKQALGAIDPLSPPIAGLDGIAATQGITTQYVYDNRVSDGFGLDSSAGITINRLGVGTASVNIQAALTKLADTVANGGADVTFASSRSGKATVAISPVEKTMNVSIQDAMGRGVFQGLMSGPAATTPNQLLSWTSVGLDKTYTLAGVGLCEATWQIMQDGKYVQSVSNSLGQSVATLDQLAKLSRSKYNAAGNLLQQIDPLSNTTNFEYDLLGRQTKTINPLNNQSETVYHATTGRVTSQKDAKGQTTSFTYNPLGQILTTTDRTGKVTAQSYNLMGLVASVTDAQGKTTSYTYNVLGAKTEETYPDHTGGNPGDSTYGKVKFFYDPAGRMIRREDQEGDTVTFNHTMIGSITSRDYRTKANSPSGTIADSDTFTFDAVGRMLTAVSGRYSNTVTMTYDNEGRLKDESLTIASRTYTVTRGYDSLGRLSQLTYPNGSVVERTYTDRSQLHTVKYLGTTVDTRTYDDGRRLATSTYANGAVITFNYRADNLISSIATSHSGTEKLGTYSYTWDANKNKTGETITGTMSGFGFSTGSTGYDDEDRLTVWNRTNGTMDQSWTLSEVGNWNAFTSAGSTWNRTHSDAHEFTGFTGASSGTLTYDVKGNQTSRPATLSSPALNLDWNFDNQLIGADTNGSPSSLEVTFEYDALGRRVARSHSSGNVVYVHAGQQVIADYARGAVTTSPTYRYVYADYVDEPILRHTGTASTLPTTGNNALYYHRNQQYSIVGLTNAAGTLVERYTYTAYGTLGIYAANGTVRTTSSYNNRYTYTGREYDPDLKLYHFRARWYDPATGGFISRDPLGYVDGSSLYRAYFAPGSVDPSGTIVYSTHYGQLAWDWYKNDYLFDEETGLISGPTRIPGAYIGVKTSKGTMVGVWAPDDRENNKDAYWCHGFTFGGSHATGGPYSLYGQYVPTVLEDEGWNRICCENATPISDIVVFSDGRVTHSGVVVSIKFNGLIFDEEASMLSSKPGNSAHETSSFLDNAHGKHNYGGYSCYSQRRPPDEECCSTGKHEVAPPKHFEIGPRTELMIEALIANKPVRDRIIE